MRGLRPHAATLARVQYYNTAPLLLSFNIETFLSLSLTIHLPRSNMGSSTQPESNAAFTGNRNCFNQTNCNNTTTNITCVDKKAKILNWLSPLQPHVRHSDVRARRQDGIGEWFLEGDEFLRWRDGKGEFGKTTLFCSGNPGVGKTFLR